MPKIVTLPGDGIGPEIMDAALRVLQTVAPDVETEEHLFGGAAIDAKGSSLPDETLAACKSADAGLLKRELIEGVDMLVIRELTGGIYFGEKTRTEHRASDLCVYTTEEIERI